MHSNEKEPIQDLAYLATVETQKSLQTILEEFFYQKQIHPQIYTEEGSKVEGMMNKKDAPPHNFRTIPGTPIVLATVQHPDSPD